MNRSTQGVKCLFGHYFKAILDIIGIILHSVPLVVTLGECSKPLHMYECVNYIYRVLTCS